MTHKEQNWLMESLPLWKVPFGTIVKCFANLPHLSFDGLLVFLENIPDSVFAWSWRPFSLPICKLVVYNEHREKLHKMVNCQALQTNRQTLSVHNFFWASCVTSHFSVASSHIALITQEHKSPVRLNSFANIAPPPGRDIIGVRNSHRIQCSHKTIWNQSNVGSNPTNGMKKQTNNNMIL